MKNKRTGTTITFDKTPEGLSAYDLQHGEVTLLNTVEEMRKHYTNRQYER